MTEYNPISSPIVSIILHSEQTNTGESTDGSADGSNTHLFTGFDQTTQSGSSQSDDFDVDVMLKNNFCQFERMEMEESVVNIFPTGALILRDITDIVTYIAKKEIKTIIVKFSTGEIYKWYITSISYINNAASEMDQSFVAIYFTNSLFQQSQTKSFYTERKIVYNPDTNAYEDKGTQPIWPIEYPFVTTHKHIIQTYGTHAIFNAPLYPIKDKDGNAKTLNGCGVNLYVKNVQEPTNYVLFRPRVPDGHRLEQFQTNIITYLNYIFSYAVNDDNLPYYLFWSDFVNCLNYKYFNLRTDLQSEKFKFDLPSTDPGQIKAYAVFDSTDQERTFTIDDKEVSCKKIYVMVTNPAYSMHDKNYYYLRNSPVYLEEPFYKLSGATSNPLHLMSSYMSESANTLLTTVTQASITDSSGLTYAQKLKYKSLLDTNVVSLADTGYWGFAGDFNQYNNKINTVDAIAAYENLTNQIEATPLGMLDSSNPDPNKKMPPLYPFNDNRYIWQFQYDLTRTHPNLVLGSSGGQKGITEKDFYKDINDLLDAAASDGQEGTDLAILQKLLEVNLNKVMDCKYSPMKKDDTYDNFRRKQLEQAEKENFVAHVLCCIGKPLISSEEWFFAKITGYVRDLRYVETGTAWVGGANYGILDNAWLYSWQKLEIGDYIGGVTGSTGPSAELVGSRYQNMQTWTTSKCVGSTGTISSTIQGKEGFTGISTWAVNINERTNLKYKPTGTGAQPVQTENGYLGPGYWKPNIIKGGNYAYRPIGFMGATFSFDANQVGSAEQIVKMYKVPLNDIRDMGCLAPLSYLEGQYLYYFTAENAVDGIC